MKFLELFRSYIDYYRQTTIFFESRSPVTIQAYENKYSLVNAFLFDSKKIKLKASGFTIGVSKDLLEWANSKYSHNYSVRIVEICKDVLDFGIDKELIKNHNLPLLQLKRVPPGATVYLTPQELTFLENYSPHDEVLEKARDLFLLQCYTGMAYVDATNLSKHNLMFYKSREYIFKKRKKTKKDSIIPITDGIKNILNKYDYSMKIIRNSDYNAALKTIAEDLKINKHLTTHVGRKTFAMINLNWLGHSMEGTSKMLGITIKTMEQHYAQPNINLVSNELDRLGK